MCLLSTLCVPAAPAAREQGDPEVLGSILRPDNSVRQRADIFFQLDTPQGDSPLLALPEPLWVLLQGCPEPFQKSCRRSAWAPLRCMGPGPGAVLIQS